MKPIDVAFIVPCPFSDCDYHFIVRVAIAHVIAGLFLVRWSAL